MTAQRNALAGWNATLEPNGREQPLNFTNSERIQPRSIARLARSAHHARMTHLSRRSFLASVPVGLSTAALDAGPSAAAAGDPPSSFPTQDADLVREMVAVSHGNIARVKELVGRQQTLAKASYDWGFGDWETALGAASHVGNRDIAEFLLANGARPSIFSAAMLGQLDVVKAFVTAAPGVQRIKGPHSITLLRHAIAGGAAAKPIVDYLTSVGGADERIVEKPMTAEERARLAGTYVFGASARDRMDVTVNKDTLMIARTGGTARGLMHLGSFEFCPVGAENVRVRFAEAGGTWTLTIHDPDLVLTARRS